MYDYDLRPATNDTDRFDEDWLIEFAELRLDDISDDEWMHLLDDESAGSDGDEEDEDAEDDESGESGENEKDEELDDDEPDEQDKRDDQDEHDEMDEHDELDEEEVQDVMLDDESQSKEVTNFINTS